MMITNNNEIKKLEQRVEQLEQLVKRLTTQVLYLERENNRRKNEIQTLASRR